MAKRTQATLTEHISHFWNKDMWPTNTSDLNPIENLMSILEDKVEEERNQPTKILGLEKVLTDAWKKIPEETLRNLVHSIPDRVQAVLKAKGHFPVK